MGGKDTNERNAIERHLESPPNEVKERLILSAEDIDTGFENVYGENKEGEPGKAEAMFGNMTSELAQNTESRATPLTETDIQDAVGEEEQETAPIPDEVKFSPEEDPFAGTEFNPDSNEARMLAGFEAVKAEAERTIDQVSELSKEGKIDEAVEAVKNLVDKFESADNESLPPEIKAMYDDVKQNLEKVITEKDPNSKSKLFRFASGAVDFVPVVGSSKMILESFKGKTLGGEELKGWGRFLHGASGAVFLAMDCTGFGSIASEMGKGGEVTAVKMGPKLITRTAAFLRSSKVSSKVYRPLFKFGRMLAKNPEMAKATSKGLDYMIKARKAKMAELPGTLRDRPDETVPEVDSVNQRPGMDIKKEMNNSFA